MIISLTQGCCMVVDDDAPPEITDHLWLAHRRGELRTKNRPGKIYAARIVDGKVISAHRVIMNAPEGCVVDHINGCTLDNRRENLRLASPRENARNKIGNRNKLSCQRKGVYPSGRKFRAIINIAGKNTHLGSFRTEDEAARAYDRAAREHYGSFAHCNFTKEQEAAE